MQWNYSKVRLRLITFRNKLTKLLCNSGISVKLSATLFSASKELQSKQFSQPVTCPALPYLTLKRDSKFHATFLSNLFKS